MFLSHSKTPSFFFWFHSAFQFLPHGSWHSKGKLNGNKPYELKQKVLCSSTPRFCQFSNCEHGEWNLLLCFHRHSVNCSRRWRQRKIVAQVQDKDTQGHAAFQLWLRHWKYHCDRTRRACGKPPGEREIYLLYMLPSFQVYGELNGCYLIWH